MFFDDAPIMHSHTEEGKHWLTTMDFPPLQIQPLAANHCRIGHVIAKVINVKLQEFEELPEKIELSASDLKLVDQLSDTYPLQEPAVNSISVLIKMMPAAHENNDIIDEDVEFITPQPNEDWKGSYDDWIFELSKCLGLNADVAKSNESYLTDLEQAIKKSQEKIPNVRERYLKGLQNLNLGFKVGLNAESGDKEYVWISPIDLSDPNNMLCRLDCEPYDCDEYQEGQELTITITDIVDYAIGNEEIGLVEQGFTQTVAEDYGFILPS